MAHVKDEMLLGSNKLEVGLARTRDVFDPKHPIEVSEKSFRQNMEKGFFEQARMTQGFAGPLRLQIERSAAAKIGHLPFISMRSSFQVNFQLFRSESQSPNVNFNS